MAGRCDRRRFLAGGAAVALAHGSARCVLEAAEDERRGDLVGRLLYDGKAPPRAKLKVDKDIECCGKFDIRDETLVVGPEGGLANVFIYLRTRKIAAAPDAAKTVPQKVVLDNRDCIFSPHVMCIWLDRQELSIVNSDPVAQNVAFSPLGDAPANIILPSGEKGKATWKFKRRQNAPVAIACNYHPWESAYILPRDDPYMAVTGPDGRFRIAGLPPGKLEFQAWQERVGYLDTPEWPKGRIELTIAPGVNDLGTIKLSPGLFEKKS